MSNRKRASQYDRERSREEHHELEAEQACLTKLGDRLRVGNNNLISLGFRGEKTITLKRSLSCQIDESMLATNL